MENEEYIDYDNRFNALVAVERGRTVKRLMRHFGSDLRGRSILDLGCGTGRNTIIFARHGAKVIGVDLSKDMIRIARGKAREGNYKIIFEIRDAVTYFEKRKRRFDAIIANLLLAHIEDIVPVVEHIYRLLKPGGIFISTDEHPMAPHRIGLPKKYKIFADQNVWSFRHDVDVFLSTMHKAGFKVQRPREWKSDSRLEWCVNESKAKKYVEFRERAREQGMEGRHFEKGYLLGIMYVGIK